MPLESRKLYTIFLIYTDLDDNKKGQKTIKNLLPRYGSIAGFGSNRFVDELIEIGGFSKILEE